MWKALFLLLACASVYATDTTSKTKIVMYDGCMETCIPNQLKMPANKAVADVPFLITAYCSCFCARTAMRVSAEAAAKGDRVALEGKGINAVPEMAEIAAKSAPICSKSLYEN
jgi:hypothetical protein